MIGAVEPHAWFAPVAPCTGADVARQNHLARTIMDAHGMDFFSGATLNGREVLNVMPIVYNRDDAGERRRARACFDELLTLKLVLSVGSVALLLTVWLWRERRARAIPPAMSS